MNPEQRLALSERVIAGWEAMGKPGGPIPDNMRMIGAELEALRGVVAEAPELRPRIDAVTERYRVMALKLKLGMN